VALTGEQKLRVTDRGQAMALPVNGDSDQEFEGFGFMDY